MTRRIDLTQTFVVSLALIVLFAPVAEQKGQPTPWSSPYVTATATASPTPTQPPTATAISPTPTVARVEPLSTPTPTSQPTPSPSSTMTLTLPPTMTMTPTSLPTPSPTPSPLPPTRLLIPSIDLDAPIVPVGFVNSESGGQPTTSWAVPDAFAVGWHHSSQPPGQIGNTVLNGHQNGYGAVLANLAHTRQGDEIIVYAGETAYRYRVAAQHLLEDEGQPLEVRAQNAQWIMPTQDERLTLVTCAPYPHSSQRLIVVALPVVMEDEGQWTKDERWPHTHY